MFYLDDEGSSTGCCCLSVGGSNICSRSSLESSNSANWSISAMISYLFFFFFIQNILFVYAKQWIFVFFFITIRNITFKVQNLCWANQLITTFLKSFQSNWHNSWFSEFFRCEGKNYFLLFHVFFYLFRINKFVSVDFWCVQFTWFLICFQLEFVDGIKKKHHMKINELLTLFF